MLVAGYELVRPLGEGGMARLFLGRHCSDGHEAAIKILHDEMAHDDSLRVRFCNEARAIASIRHPNVVQLYEFGQTSDGNIFLAMEYVAGQTLEDRLVRDRILSIPMALAIVDQMAGALAAAHELGIAHRDLKPNNVMLAEKDGWICSKLLDFGIAKFFDRNGDDPGLTKTGIIVGTPKYMAPEQCMGAADIDHRADVYSLGVILYRMVTGRLPYLGRGPGEIIAAHLHGTPRSPRMYRPELTPQIEAIILRCMAKGPDQRFQSMAELSAAVRAELSRSQEDTYDDDVIPTTIDHRAFHSAMTTAPKARPGPYITATEQTALPGRDTVADSPGARLRQSGLPVTAPTRALHPRTGRPVPERARLEPVPTPPGMPHTRPKPPSGPQTPGSAEPQFPPSIVATLEDENNEFADPKSERISREHEIAEEPKRRRHWMLWFAPILFCTCFALVAWQDYVLAFVDSAWQEAAQYLPSAEEEANHRPAMPTNSEVISGRDLRPAVADTTEAIASTDLQPRLPAAQGEGGESEKPAVEVSEPENEPAEASALGTGAARPGDEATEATGEASGSDEPATVNESRVRGTSKRRSKRSRRKHRPRRNDSNDSIDEASPRIESKKPEAGKDIDTPVF